MARLHPEVLHVRVMELFATFLHYSPSRYDDGAGEMDFESHDNRQIMVAINGRNQEQKDIERKQGFDLEERLRETALEHVLRRLLRGCHGRLQQVPIGL